MKTEFLKSLNLSQEVIDKIMAENGKDIAVEQKKAEKVIQERDSYKLKAESLETQVNDANTEIQKFKDMDIDGIKKAADDWKETAEKAKADADKQISQMKFDYALSAALTGAKAKNAKAVKALLDMDGLKFNDGKIVGLDEQLAQIKADNDYLFESDEPAPEFVKGTNGGSGSVGGKKPSEMTYTELCEKAIRISSVPLILRQEPFMQFFQCMDLLVVLHRTMMVKQTLNPKEQRHLKEGLSLLAV